MSLTHSQMDQLVNDHFRFEAADDVDGVLGTLSEEAEHEAIPSPMRALTDTAEIRTYYEMLFSNVHGDSVTPVRRLYGQDFLIDETLWHGHIEDGRPYLCDGKSAATSASGFCTSSRSGTARSSASRSGATWPPSRNSLDAPSARPAGSS
jgi:ketosteroid isomerase-like protein